MFASWLVMKGADLATVKELLGYKDIKMTLRYAHLSKSHIDTAVKMLDKKNHTFFIPEKNVKNSKP
jgi:site-specific recombinase XerD